MQISQSAWILWWAYLMDPERRPVAGEQVNLCDVCWRAVALSPLVCLFVVVASPAWVSICCADWVQQRMGRGRVASLGQLVTELARAKKQRYCPRVEVV